MAPMQKPTKKFHCDKCTYSTNEKSNLTRHKFCHGKIPKSVLRCPEGNCTNSFSRLEDIDEHLRHTHGRNLEVDHLFFENENELKIWKQDLQKLHLSRFVAKGNTSAPSFYYYCHRSCQFTGVSTSTGKRNPKKIGSIKSERICTSRIKVVKTKKGLNVQYFKTHSGHTVEPGHVGLISPEKRNIAEQLRIGVPKQQVLNKIRSNLTDEVTRLSLSNMKDIENSQKVSNQFRNQIG